MDTFSNEEKVAKEFLQNGQVDLILNIVDASNLNRNLYLTTQLKEFNKPIILAVNMIDIAESKGIFIDYEKLSKLFDIEIIPISAGKNIGIDKVASKLQEANFEHSVDNTNFNFSSEDEAYLFIEDTLKQCIKSEHSNETTTSEK